MIADVNSEVSTVTSERGGGGERRAPAAVPSRRAISVALLRAERGGRVTTRRPPYVDRKQNSAILVMDLAHGHGYMTTLCYLNV
ncbi:unnamed protein product [Pieris macdunnoughi]|uniref:Uncharacterized protein n=1 Tax=Pieris macdunnoughi TaxID=345717 RepID=A0A821MTF4_9NEOP|nr:unnamed protein product [Pieris macdunnoughi]